MAVFVIRRTHCVVSVAPEIGAFQLSCVLWGEKNGLRYHRGFFSPPSSLQYHNDSSTRLLLIFIHTPFRRVRHCHCFPTHTHTHTHTHTYHFKDRDHQHLTARYPLNVGLPTKITQGNIRTPFLRQNPPALVHVCVCLHTIMSLRSSLPVRVMPL